MREGIYESLVTRGLAEDLTTVSQLEKVISDVDEGDHAHVLARHVELTLRRTLQTTRDSGRRLEIVNELLTVLAEPAELIDSGVRQLLTLTPPPAPGSPQRFGRRPATPLSDAALLTNAQDEPNLGAELRAELDTSDEVDLLCAFVKWHGLRLLEPELRRLRERGVRLRVITTTYMGATERAALDRLVREFGAEVKIQYDALRTRLHAKAWLFRRDTGFDTAYVGSSNLSRARCSTASSGTSACPGSRPEPARRSSTATFDTYWNDTTFRAVRPGHGPGPPGRCARRGIGPPRARPGDASPCPGWRCARIPTSRRCWRRSTSSGACTTVTAIWSSPPPAPARR